MLFCDAFLRYHAQQLVYGFFPRLQLCSFHDRQLIGKFLFHMQLLHGRYRVGIGNIGVGNSRSL